MPHPPLIAIQQRKAAMNAVVVVVIDAVAVVGNALSAVKVAQK